MKWMTVMLMLALAASVSAIEFLPGMPSLRNNDTGIEYSEGSILYDLLKGNVGYASFSTNTAAATDTVKVLIRTNATNYSQVWLRINAVNRRTTDIGIMYGTVLFSPILQRAAVTAADTVTIRNLNTNAIFDAPILRTFTVAAAKNTTLAQIGMFTPYAPLTMGPFINTPSANDSIGWGFLVIPTDSLRVTWEILTIKR